MSKKLIYLVSLVVVLGAVGMARAELIGHWTLDETSGTTATDSSGRGHDGTYVNTPALDIPAVFGTGMDALNGYMEVDLGDDLPIQAEERTIALWLSTDQVRGDRKFISYGSGNNGQAFTFTIENVDNADGVRMRHWGGNMFYPGFTIGEWNHLAMRVPAGATIVNDTEVFINGQNIAGYRSEGSDRTLDTTATLFRVGTSIDSQAGQVFEGLFDDVHFFDHALSDAEVLSVMESQPRPYARGPNPPDGSLYEAAWVTLSWKPGDFAVSHDMYVGDNFDDVNDGAEGTFAGNTFSTTQVLGFPGFPIPEGLQPGTTYYWRIDEVNDADPNSPWKGSVWSFTVPPKKAYDSDPPDGARFVDSGVTLSWTGGLGAKLHHVYFGDNFDDVSNAAGALPQTDATFTPGTLELDKTYYWRIDEFDGIATHKGDVWTFTTAPVIPITDPNLVAWWTFDEGSGDIALDWSGHGNHGTLVGPEWTTAAVHGDAALDSSDGYVAIQNLSYNSTGLGEVTVCSWIRTSSEFGQYIVSFDRNEYYRLEINGDGAGPGQVGWDVMTSSGQVDYGSNTRVDNGAWHHITGVFDNGRLTIYIDGVAEPSVTGGSTYGSGNARFGFIGANSEATSFNDPIPGGTSVTGQVDDIRIYDRALSQEEIVLVMRGDPLLAWAPSPADGSTPDVDNVTPLTWTAGDGASSHEVYFGTDADAVKNADTSDTTGVYRGRQSTTSFTPAEGVEWGAGPFYWRIDENNADGTVTAGRVWSFTVGDFILVDDFESYTDDDAANEAIWQHWIDGFGVPTNGAQAGYLMPPYAEQTIVSGGAQSMPLIYNNTAGVTNSEVALALTAPRDWTKHGVGVLSLWFRGYPPSVGSFTEGPVGTFTMTGSGADIWGTSDQFHFAYKTLTGTGSIVARVDSIENTHAWAKAGVMIRETLDADSKYAFAVVSSASGVAFQYRTDTGVGAAGVTEAGIAAPLWLKVERDAGGNFSVSHSTNGSSWVPVASAVPTNIPMASNVYIGLAVTSHDAALTCEAKLSNVTTTGTVGLQWMNQDIGILGNNAEPLYVALSNNNGTIAVVVNSDANAAVTDVWTEWLIDLSGFADQGVNLSDVDKIAIGLGSTGDANATGGSGTVFIDDVRLRRPVSDPQP